MMPDDNNYNENDDEQTKEEALRPDNGTFSPDLDEPKLAGDYDPPSAPADDDDRNYPQLPPDHPQTDSSLDEHEVYDEGITDASGANDALEEPDNRPRPLEVDDDQ